MPGDFEWNGNSYPLISEMPGAPLYPLGLELKEGEHFVEARGIYIILAESDELWTIYKQGGEEALRQAILAR